MAALDHSQAHRIALVDDKGALTDAPVRELPPQALRFFAEMLGMMAQRRPVMLVPQNHELTTQDAAALLNVSRPFVIKEIEAGRLRCRKVGRHRRIEFEELRRYQADQTARSEQALQKLAELSQDLGLWALMAGSARYTAVLDANTLYPAPIALGVIGPGRTWSADLAPHQHQRHEGPVGLRFRRQASRR